MVVRSRNTVVRKSGRMVNLEIICRMLKKMTQGKNIFDLGLCDLIDRKSVV